MSSSQRKRQLARMARNGARAAARSKRYPLRKVVSEHSQFEANVPAWELECGHKVHPPRDITGPRYPERMRCAQCFRESAQNVGEKRCTRCDEVKSRDDFSRDHAAKDGRRAWCKACAAESSREWRENNRERFAANLRAWRAANPERSKEIERRSRARYPEKDKARLAMKAPIIDLYGTEITVQPLMGSIGPCVDIERSWADKRSPLGRAHDHDRLTPEQALELADRLRGAAESHG